jgi:hypothetical protein
MACKRCRILLVDKKNRFSYLFNGFRKNKFTFFFSDSVFKHSDQELYDVNVFFFVLYDNKDIIQLIKLFKFSPKIIVASDNYRLLKLLIKLNSFPIVDLTGNENIGISLNNSFNQILS